MPLNFDHLTISDGLSHNTVYCVLQDSYGYIWIGTQNGLNKYDGYSFDVYRSNGQEASIAIYIKPPFWKTLWFRSLSFVLLVSLIISGILFLIKRREAAYNRQILQLQNEILTDLKKDLKDLKNKSRLEFQPLLHKLDRELKSEDYWQEFNVYFNQVDQNFIKAIREKHPQLTQNDIRLCALLHINLSTKEIASLLNISSRGVEQSRYRLKKRLDLDKYDDLLK